MNGQEPNLRKIDAIVLLFVTIVMFVVGYTRSAAFSNDLPVQNPPAKVTPDRESVQSIKLDR
jgi:hypothetical protein